MADEGGWVGVALGEIEPAGGKARQCSTAGNEVWPPSHLRSFPIRMEMLRGIWSLVVDSLYLQPKMLLHCRNNASFSASLEIVMSGRLTIIRSFIGQAPRLAAFSVTLCVTAVVAATQVWSYPLPRFILLVCSSRALAAAVWIISIYLLLNFFVQDPDKAEESTISFPLLDRPLL